MAFTKIYNGAGSGAVAGAYGDSRNWELTSLRSAAYAWTQVGATAEYYVRTAGGANPGFAASPPASNGVYINGSAATQGTLTALTAGQWAYGDPATLGYSTVVVRITGDGDPDAQLADYVQFRQIPQAAEVVRVPRGAGDITSNLDQSAVAIAGFFREPGHTGTIGTSSSSLRIAPTRLEDHGNGQSFFDIGSANITVVANNNAPVSNGEYSLNLRGTNIALIDYRGGLLGIAAYGGELSTFTALIGAPNTSGGIKIGSGVTATSATVTLHGGTLWANCSLGTINNYAGAIWIGEAAAITTLSQWGGEFHYGSSGNIATLNIRGGRFNELAGNATRTIAAVNKYRGSWTINRNKEAVAHTAVTDQDSYSQSGSGA